MTRTRPIWRGHARDGGQRAGMAMLLDAIVRLYYSVGARLLYYRILVQVYCFLKVSAWLKRFRRSYHFCEQPDGTIRLSDDFAQRILEGQHGPDIPRIESARIASAVGGGFIGAVNTIEIVWPAGTDEGLPRTLLMKTVLPTVGLRCASLLQGQTREAEAYRWSGRCDLVKSLMARCYYADCSSLTGEFVVIMEDLSPDSIAATKLLGNQCWGPCEVPARFTTDRYQIFETIYLKAADLHAAYWRDRSLLSKPWLKYTDYHRGKDRKRYELGLIAMKACWRRVEAHLQQGGAGFVFSDRICGLFDEASRSSSWEAFCTAFDLERDDCAFTLAHGDFHAFNMLWSGDEAAPFRLCDWSEVGVFCPFTDLAQLLVSNAEIGFRRENERRLFDAYHGRLIERGVDGKVFPLDACWTRYKSGGIERWLQMLAIMSSMSIDGHLPASATQWFHDQADAFVQDHLNECPRPVRFLSNYPMAK